MTSFHQPYTPGIAVLSGDYLHSVVDLHSLLVVAPGKEFTIYTPPCPSWLSVGICTRLSEEQACYSDADQLTIVFDGYLSDVADHKASHTLRSQPARTIAELYRAHGVDGFCSLRGSYSFLVLDTKSEQAIMVNDRLGSRPVFYRKTSDGVAIAPTVFALSMMTGSRAKIDQASVIEFTLTGAFRGTHTLFKGIHKLPQGGMFALNPQRCENVERYWRFSFDPQDADKNLLVDECDALLQQAVQRSMCAVSNAVLGLSGGLDSRVVLGYLQKNGYSEIPAVSFSEAETQGDDASVARCIAESFDLPLTSFIINLEDFANTASEAVIKVDCAAMVIDSAPLTRLWGQLAQQFGCFINGDECFGWHDSITSVSGALTEIGWFHIDQVPRVADWINRDIVSDLRNKINQRLDNLVASADQDDPNDLKDKLYYEERLGNMLNAFTAQRLNALEPARPLVDEDIIDFVARIPRFWREDKRLLRETFTQRFPGLNQLPYASKDVLPVPATFQKMIAKNPEIGEFFESNLIEHLDPALADILDTARFAQTVHALLHNKALPSLHSGLLSRIPGMWRFAKPQQNRRHPFIAMLHVLQLNLYLSTLSNSSPQSNTKLVS
ncbi:MAG TPA: hypothetical protein ENH39_01075 [Gammaproteobacteria bacterium]|nr:hypothetical protein [Gammaproteobacteria bacterium]